MDVMISSDQENRKARNNRLFCGDPDPDPGIIVMLLRNIV